MDRQNLTTVKDLPRLDELQDAELFVLIPEKTQHRSMVRAKLAHFRTSLAKTGLFTPTSVYSAHDYADKKLLRQVQDLQNEAARRKALRRAASNNEAHETKLLLEDHREILRRVQKTAVMAISAGNDTETDEEELAILKEAMREITELSEPVV